LARDEGELLPSQFNHFTPEEKSFGICGIEIAHLSSTFPLVTVFMAFVTSYSAHLSFPNSVIPFVLSVLSV
jgi:hypothetical protein